MKEEIKNEQNNKIRIETSADLFRLPPSVIKNTKIYDFQGKYFDHIYEEALKIERSGGLEKFTTNIKNVKEKEVKIDKLTYQMTYTTQMGQQLAVIGSINALGNWNQDKALKMTWTEGNVWISEITTDIINTFDYKFIFIVNNKVQKWEDGNNRIFNYNDVKGLIESNKKNVTNDTININNVNKLSYEYNFKNNSLKIFADWNQK